MSFVAVNYEQVFGNVLQVALQDSSPLVPQAKFIKTWLVQRFQVDCASRHGVAHTLPQLRLLPLVCERHSLQIDVEGFIGGEE